MYIYIYIIICVCVCFRSKVQLNPGSKVPADKGIVNRSSCPLIRFNRRPERLFSVMAVESERSCPGRTAAPRLRPDPPRLAQYNTI